MIKCAIRNFYNFDQECCQKAGKCHFRDPNFKNFHEGNAPQPL